MNRRFATPMAEPFISDRVLAYLSDISKKSAILDIACGQGYLLELVEEKGFFNLNSADINEDNFKLDKRKYRFRKLDANIPLPYKGDSFDVVISSETIEHLENPQGFLREIYRILKPTGILILTTPNIGSIISRLYFLITGKLAFHTEEDYVVSGHIAVLPGWLIERFTRKTGFKKVDQTYNCFYIPILKIRITHPIFLRKFFGWVTIYKFKK